MKRYILICLLALAALSITAMAQGHPGSHNHGNGHAPSFEQFLAEKINFLVKDMQLNAQDSAQFVTVYREMNDAKGQLMRKYRNSHETYRKLFSGETLPDSVYIKVVMNNAQLQLEDAQLEKDYLEKFSKFLTPKQLFGYHQAERKFRNELMQRPRGGKR